MKKEQFWEMIGHEYIEDESIRVDYLFMKDQELLSIDENDQRIIQTMINAQLKEQELPKEENVIASDRLFESVIQQDFYSLFHRSYIHDDADQTSTHRETSFFLAQRDTFTYNEFVNSILTGLLNTKRESKPRDKAAYQRLITKMGKGFSQLKNKKTRVIGILLSYYYLTKPDLNSGSEILQHYIEGDIDSFMDQWVFTLVPEIKHLSSYQPGKKLSLDSNPDTEYLMKKLQLAEIISSMRSIDDEGLKQFCSQEDGAGFFTYHVGDTPLLTYRQFETIVRNSLPPEERKAFKFTNFVSRGTQTNYRNFSKGGVKPNKSTCETYAQGLTSAVGERWKYFEQNLLYNLRREQGDSVAFLLEFSRRSHMDSHADFLLDVMRRVDVFASSLGDLKGIPIGTEIIVQGDDLLKYLYEIVLYRDQSFESPLTNGKSLSRDTYLSVNRKLAEFIADPRILYSQQLYDLGYWLTDNLDKKKFGRDATNLYSLVPDIVMTLFRSRIRFQMLSNNSKPTYQDIREVNGAGYSLVLTGNEMFIELGYRMISLARQWFEEITGRKTRQEDLSETDYHIQALLWSNMATYFLQRTILENRKEEKGDSNSSSQVYRLLCLTLARNYSERALKIRIKLAEEDSTTYAGFAALSYTNLGKAEYYSGMASEGETASHFFTLSLTHHLESLRRYRNINEKSDHIIRLSRDIFGTTAALISCEHFIGISQVTDIPGAERETYEYCLKILRTYDSSYRYCTPQDIQDNEQLVRDIFKK